MSEVRVTRSETPEVETRTVECGFMCVEVRVRKRDGLDMVSARVDEDLCGFDDLRDLVAAATRAAEEAKEMIKAREGKS